MKKRWLDFIIGVPLVWFIGLFVKKKWDDELNPKKILLIKLAAVGDTILIIPTLRQLRALYPHAVIHWWVSPINVDIAKTVPYVDRIWVSKITGIIQVIMTILTFRKERFDLIIDFEQWARGTAIISALSKAKQTIGFDSKGQFRSKVFTKTIQKSDENHESQEFMRLIPSSSKRKGDDELELWETEKGQLEIQEILPSLNKPSIRKRILIHPGCGGDGLPREWPLADYGVLINWLIQNFNAEIFVTSGPEEKEKAQRLENLTGGKVTNLGGLISWLGTITLVSKMDMVISGNTGVMHMAAALKKPQVAIHGPTNSKMWGPLNKKAQIIKSPCSKCPSLKLGFEYHSKTQDCMKKIDVQSVKKAVQSLIDNNGRI